MRPASSPEWAAAVTAARKECSSGSPGVWDEEWLVSGYEQVRALLHSPRLASRLADALDNPLARQ